MSNGGTREYVTRVIDGDSFETQGNALDVRLEGVDTPEKGESGISGGEERA